MLQMCYVCDINQFCDSGLDVKEDGHGREEGEGGMLAEQSVEEEYDLNNYSSSESDGGGECCLCHDTTQFGCTLLCRREDIRCRHGQ